MKNILGKTWIIGIMILFVGASVLPSINANIEEAGDITLKQEQAKPLMVFWEDNFDSYDEGQDLHGVGGWKGWDNVPAATAYVTADQALSSPHSVDILEVTDLVHEYVATSGEWTYTAWQYIPDEFIGQSYFILLSDYIDGGPNTWAVQLNFWEDSQIVESQFDGAELPLITGKWVEIRVEIDLDGDWMEIFYDGDLLVEKEWSATVQNTGGGPLVISAVDLFANSASSVYYDDMSLVGEATGPDLDCEGDLDWVDVTTGETVTGSFTVENIGATGSELNWEIESYPDWGTSWTFTPDSGTGLKPEDGTVTINVEVVAPGDTETEFTGSVKIVNIDNTADYCTIDASLVTPVSHNMPFLQWFINRHPIIAGFLGL